MILVLMVFPACWMARLPSLYTLMMETVANMLPPLITAVMTVPVITVEKRARHERTYLFTVVNPLEKHILMNGDKIKASGNVSLDFCKQNHHFGECYFWAAVRSKARALGRVTAAAA